MDSLEISIKGREYRKRDKGAERWLSGSDLGSERGNLETVWRTRSGRRDGTGRDEGREDLRVLGIICEEQGRVSLAVVWLETKECCRRRGGLRRYGLAEKQSVVDVGREIGEEEEGKGVALDC